MLSVFFCLCQERGSVGAGRSQMEVLKRTLQAFAVPDELNWLGEGDKGYVLENSWTDIVHSHKVHYLKILKYKQLRKRGRKSDRNSGVCDGEGE